MYTKSGIFAGKNAGFHVTKPEVNPRKQTPVFRRGRLGKRIALVREVIREVSGYAPYERKMIKLLTIGDESAEKRALKFAKRRIGGHRRGKLKRESMRNIVALQKKAAKEKAIRDAKAAKEAREKAEKEGK